MIGTTLHHYRIVRALGHGGMGAVYAAEDMRLGRTVALKVIPPDLAVDPVRLARFQREARALAAINHDNIVTIYGVEHADGVHFLTMELIEGRTLGASIPTGGCPIDRLLALAVPLVDAVAAAHEHGIVHRDLKPANVMVTPAGRVKVLDFGLAKQVGSEGGDAATTQDLTARQQVVGTAAYMSPEQAQGQPTDHRSDIFSLGIILYEMATGVHPFPGDSSLSVLSAILKDDPAPPSQRNPRLSPDLDRIIRRCLAKQPERRYQSALDLRNDLEDLRPGSRPGSSRRFQRAPAAGIAAIVLIAVTGAAIVAWLAWRGASQAHRPRTEFTQLTAMPGVEWFPSLSPDGKWIVYGATPGRWRHIYLQSVTGQNPIDLTRDSEDDNDQPAFSPDGERIAFRSSRAGGGLFVMGRTGEAVRRVTRAGFNPSWSPDGKSLVYTTEAVEVYPQNSQGTSELWTVDVDTGRARRLLDADAVMPSWSPHNKRIAFMQRLRLAAAGAPTNGDLWTVPVGGGPVVRVTTDRYWDWNPIWSPDGRYLYFVSDRGGSMNLWRLPIDEESGQPRGEPEPITTPAAYVGHPSISGDGTRIAFSSALIAANIQRLGFDPVTLTVTGDPAWVTTGTRRWSSPDPSADGNSVVFYTLALPEGDLFIAHQDGTGLAQVTGDASIDRVPRWSPDGRWIAFFSNRSGTLELWMIRPDGSELQQLTQGGGSYLAWSPDGTRIATASAGGLPQRRAFVFDPHRPWNAQRPQPLPPFGEGRFAVNSWSPDGDKIVGQVDAGRLGIAYYSFSAHAYERLTDEGEWPVWLPDSRHVLYVAHGNAFSVVDRVTKERRQVYTSARDVLGPPRLTRDGRIMNFSRRVTESDIWLVTLK